MDDARLGWTRYDDQEKTPRENEMTRTRADFITTQQEDTGLQPSRGTRVACY